MYDTENNPLQEVADKLPTPKGFKVLVAVAGADNKRGSIYLPEPLVDRETTASVMGYVVSMGDVAYRDEQRFPTGPWCEVGDWVFFHPYSGTRFKVGDQEFRFLNDDTIQAVVNRPDAIERL